MPNHRGGGVSNVMKEGYVEHRLRGAPYKFAATITSSAERIFPLLESLSSYVGFPCMAVLQDHIDEPYVVYSSTDRMIEEALEVFKEYSFRLINDGFTGFGLASRQFEVFVGDHKRLNIYCNSLTGVRKTMIEFGIPKKSKVKWIGHGNHYHVQLGALFADEIKPMNEPLPEAEITKHDAGSEAYTDFQNDIIDRLGLKIDSWRRNIAKGP